MTATKANYKATFILDTRGREESVDELVDSLKGEIEAAGGEVSKVENLGKQDFAQVADRSYTSGVYAQYDFSGEVGIHAALLEKLRLNKLVSHKIIQKA